MFELSQNNRTVVHSTDTIPSRASTDTRAEELHLLEELPLLTLRENVSRHSEDPAKSLVTGRSREINGTVTHVPLPMQTSPACDTWYLECCEPRAPPLVFNELAICSIPIDARLAKGSDAGIAFAVRSHLNAFWFGCLRAQLVEGKVGTPVRCGYLFSGHQNNQGPIFWKLLCSLSGNWIQTRCRARRLLTASERQLTHVALWVARHHRQLPPRFALRTDSWDCGCWDLSVAAARGATFPAILRAGDDAWRKLHEPGPRIAIPKSRSFSTYA